MFIHIGHEETIGAGSQIPEGINADTQGYRLKAGTAENIGIADFFLLDAASSQFCFLFLGSCPFGGFRHFKALIPNPGSNHNQMRKNQAVAQKAKHLIHGNRGCKHNHGAKHPRYLCRTAVFCPISGWCFLGDKGPGSHHISTDHQTDNYITQKEHRIIGCQADNRHTNHINQKCPVIHELTTILVANLAANQCTNCRTTGIGRQRCQQAHLHTAHAQIVLPHTQA